MLEIEISNGERIDQSFEQFGQLTNMIGQFSLRSRSGIDF